MTVYNSTFRKKTNPEVQQRFYPRQETLEMSWIWIQKIGTIWKDGNDTSKTIGQRKKKGLQIGKRNYDLFSKYNSF